MGSSSYYFLMRLLTWNICFGGIGAGKVEYDPVTSLENVQKIALAILDKAADIIVLEEYRDTAETGGIIKAKLGEADYTCFNSNPGLNKNGILIALSKNVTSSYTVSPSKSFLVSENRLDEIYRYRWLNLKLASDLESFEILGLHIPDVRQGRKGSLEAFAKSLGYKQLIWDALIEYAKGQLKTGREAIITGDFNTGINAEDQSPGAGNFYLSDRMALLKQLKNSEGHKLVDAWRKFHQKPGPEDYTWFHGKTGFRLDYLFLTPKLGETIEMVTYSHKERSNSLSDHSALLANINLQ